MITAERVLTTATDTMLFTGIRASLSDVAVADDLSKAGMQIGIFAGAAVILGPIIARLMMSTGTPLHHVYLLSAICQLMLHLRMKNKFDETLSKSKRQPFKWSGANPFAFLKLLTHSKAITCLMSTSALQTMLDGRNVGDNVMLYQQDRLGWTPEQSSMFIAGAGLKIFGGGILGKPLLAKLGQRNLSSFSNYINMIGCIIAAQGTSAAHILHMVVTVLGERKRDGVESMATALGVQADFPKGELAASLGNWRTIACTVSPVLIGRTYVWSTTAPRNQPEMMFYLMFVINALAEASFRCLNQQEVDAACSKTVSK
jgi:hypothetical protein